MKASAVIAEIQKLIDEHGDLPIKIPSSIDNEKFEVITAVVPVRADDKKEIKHFLIVDEFTEKSLYEN